MPTQELRNILVTLGARNVALEERAEHDYYATEPKAADLLLEKEPLSKTIWECACGEGHLAKRFAELGHNVIATDIVDRGYGGVLDFLSAERNITPDADIVTNPPYSLAQQFVEHALDIVDDGRKVAMFLKIQFLELKRRRKMFDERPPKAVYVCSERVQCVKNGDFDKYVSGSAMCYAWYVWVKGYHGDTTLKWIN